MDIKCINNINDAACFAICKKAEIKGRELRLSVTCYSLNKHWIGFALCYDAKIETDRRIYMISADSIKNGKKYTILSAVIDLNCFPFRSTNWFVKAVYAEADAYYAARVQYKTREQGMFPFIFSKDCFVDRNRETVFCYRTGKGTLGLRYRPVDRFDSVFVRIKECIATVLTRLHHNRFEGHKVYLIYEKRCQKAQDNGFYLFRYMMKNNIEKQLNAEIYYVIDRNSADRQRLSVYSSHVLDFMSLKHMMAVISCTLLISPDSRAHAYCWQPVKSRIAPVINKKDHIFLGHGVLALKRLNNSFSAKVMRSVICTVTSEKEKNIVTDELGFSPDRVVTTGYARFDALNDLSDDYKEILIMPTHRSWLFGVERSVFTGSEYYKRYMDLLNSEKLEKMLEDNDLTVNYYVHPSIKEHADAFSSKYERIRLVPFGSVSIDELMMRCSMLITDYSSVAWDVCYMSKPVVFYQFDIKEYLNTWGSYVNLDTDLPGDRTDSLDELCDIVEWYIQNGFAVKESYEKKRKQMFAYLDHNNCKRICDVIRKRNY